MEGKLIAGKYRLERPLGKGAMGSVWLAEHQSLHTHVAIKLIHFEAAQNALARTRFDREAQLSARIRSAHVVKVLDHGTTDEGLPYIVMECLTGESLRERLRARKRLTPVETAKVVSHVCRALSRAHEAGLVHRDIKPENIFVAREDDEEIIKILDFGVAKATDALAIAGMDPTRTGTLLGTPYYMSPEQARGLKSIDSRSDLWSVGVLVFECLTGRRPFTAPALGPLIAKIVSGPPPSVLEMAPDAQIPAEVEAWMQKALSIDPDARFASAKQLSEAFMVAAGAVDTIERKSASSLPDIVVPPAPPSAAPDSGAAPTQVLPSTSEASAPAPVASPLPVAAEPPMAVTPPLPAAPAPLSTAVGAVVAAPPAGRGLIWAVVVLGVALLVVSGILVVVLLR
jgi:serine/threonine-protein kinase